ncbi:MAG: hypothetical protein LBV58_02350 [Acholeplasmatales bacterium]|jgi:hypothetical protein|nr:hypothetical protein [Acholeplasmatales bacterium]
MSNYLKILNQSNESQLITKVRLDGIYSEKLKKFMLESNKNLTGDTVDEIFINGLNILRNCPNPEKDIKYSSTGLIIGKVQSGKTSNFISLISLAFDNGYNICVIIGGNTRELLQQNAERIKNSFEDSHDIKVLTTVDNKEILNDSEVMGFINRGKKVIIVSLKWSKIEKFQHLNKISDLFNSQILSLQNTLIIDDEGDQASLNAKVYSKDKSMSQTYNKLIEIKSKINRSTFISVTATPQANIMIDMLDKLSPDFYELIQPGKGYCGLDVFHGEMQDIYIKSTDVDSEDLIESEGLTESFISAISLFFVGNAIRKSRGDRGIHSMLIHPSFKINVHLSLATKINSKIKFWKDLVNDGIDEYEYVHDLKPILIKAYENYKSDGVKMVSFCELECDLIDSIKECSYVLIMNSSSWCAKANAKQYDTRIYLGGNIVERGLTIDGLALTYIIRRPKGKANLDTVEQRARWFGYKEDYIDICRVFCTSQIKEDFALIRDSDDDMWTKLLRFKQTSLPFKNMKRQFVCSRDLNFTRRSVARPDSISFSEWKPQKYYNPDVDTAKSDREILDSYLEKININPVILQESKNNIHKLYEKIDMNTFINNCYSRLHFDVKEPLDNSFFVSLNKIISQAKLSNDLDILVMRYNIGQERQINNDYEIQQLFRGPNPNINSNDYYDGDRSMCDNNSTRIQIQIHIVRPSEMSEINYSHECLAFALFLPTKYLDHEKFQKLVIKKGENG